MMIRRSAAVLVVATAWFASARSLAQDRPAPSDAVILAAPMGDRRAGFASGQMMVAVTFPSRVPRVEVERRIESLARAGGWTASATEIRDKPVGKGITQTDVTVWLSGPPEWRSGGFWLQPFVEAFRDLNRFEILLLAKADTAFQGLRRYNSSALSVWLAQEGGPYRYVVEVRSHTGALPVLPLTQPRAAAPQNVRARTSGSSGQAYALILALAALGGLLVLAALLLRLRLRAAGPPDVHPHGSTRP